MDVAPPDLFRDNADTGPLEASAVKVFLPYTCPLGLEEEGMSIQNTLILASVYIAPNTRPDTLKVGCLEALIETLKTRFGESPILILGDLNPMSHKSVLKTWSQ